MIYALALVHLSGFIFKFLTRTLMIQMKNHTWSKEHAIFNICICPPLPPGIYFLLARTCRAYHISTHVCVCVASVL